MSRAPRLRAGGCTGIALLAFAANALLARAAIEGAGLDALHFAAVRLGAAAFALHLLLRLRGAASGRRRPAQGALLAVCSMASAQAFDLLDAGSGALIYFGAVQLTMIGAGLCRGERLGRRAAFGLALALIGLAWLVGPGATAPAPLGALLMALAGATWGVYCLRNRGEPDPLAATAAHFRAATPVACLAGAVLQAPAAGSAEGVALAALGGVVGGAFGAVVWGAAQRRLALAQAAVVQLAVPPLVSLGGVLALAETPGVRLLGASACILGGVALVLRAPPARRAG